MKEAIVKFVKRYPFTFLSILALGLVMIKIFNFGDIYWETSTTILTNLISAALMSVIIGSFMLDKIFDCYPDKMPAKIRENSLLVNFLYCVVAFILFMLLKAIPNPMLDERDYFIYFYYPMIFSAIACYFIVKKKSIELSEYTAKIFMNTLVLFLLECVIAAGIAILFYIYYALFKNVDYELFVRIILFQGIIVTYTGFLIVAENVDGNLSVFAKVLIKYVMFIMVLVGFAFFYIYLFRIIISREIPSNQAFVVCVVLFASGLTTALMARSFNENTIYDKIIEYLPIAYIPALVLQIISIFLRIGQYGLTISRYTGIIIVIFEIVYIAIYLFKNDKLSKTFIVQAILIFVMSVMPFLNAYQFPEIYNNIFKKQEISIEKNNNSDTYGSESIENKSIADEDKITIIKYYYLHEFDVSGYNKMKEAKIQMIYDNDENKMKYYDGTEVKGFNEVNVVDFDSKVIDTINLERFLNEFKNSVIRNNYSTDEDEILKDVNINLEYENKKFIINEIYITFDKNKNDYYRIGLEGYLLTK